MSRTVGNLRSCKPSPYALSASTCADDGGNRYFTGERGISNGILGNSTVSTEGCLEQEKRMKPAAGTTSNTGAPTLTRTPTTTTTAPAKERLRVFVVVGGAAAAAARDPSSSFEGGGFMGSSVTVVPSSVDAVSAVGGASEEGDARSSWHRTAEVLLQRPKYLLCFERLRVALDVVGVLMQMVLRQAQFCGTVGFS